jgi:hypothetical protein
MGTDDAIDFTEISQNDPQEGSGTAPEKQKYPDGLGLSIDEVKALIAKENKTIVDDDDPVLLIVTILNAFLHENNTMNEKYQKALKNMFSEQADGYCEQMQSVTNALKETLTSLSVEALNETHTKNMSKLAEFRRDISWLSALAFISALVNVIVFIIR